MYDQVLDNFRKAAESTMQLQQELVKSWTQQWMQAPAMPVVPSMMSGNAAASWAEQVRTFQKQWANAVSDMLTKHRETLDTQYRAGIRTIEDAFRLGDAKDPEQFSRLTTELWRQGFDCFRTIIEAQIRDFQGAAEKWFEVFSKGAAAVTPKL